MNVCSPISGTASDVEGTISATISENTLRDSRMVIPERQHGRTLDYVMVFNVIVLPCYIGLLNAVLTDSGSVLFAFERPHLSNTTVILIVVA